MDRQSGMYCKTCFYLVRKTGLFMHAYHTILICLALFLLNKQNIITKLILSSISHLFCDDDIDRLIQGVLTPWLIDVSVLSICLMFNYIPYSC